MRVFFVLLFVGFFISMQAQQVQVINFSELEKRLTTSADSIIVVNFWATWCKPCVEELPDFFKLENELKDKPFKLILVSLDFSTHLESRVLPFIKKNNISTEIILLDDPDSNSWINKIDPSWDGSIPVTLIFNKDEQIFYGRGLNYNELKQFVNQKMK